MEKIIELEGKRLEPVLLQEIKKEINDREVNKKKEKEHTEKLKIEMAY